VFVYGGFKLAMNATNKSSVMRIPYKFLYAIVPISGIFIVVARVLKYIQYFTGEKGEKAE
jgi:TRAP-type C4-dicarboxylate transport system permease small subunit